MNQKERKMLIQYILLAYSFSWLCWVIVFFFGYENFTFLDMTTMEFANWALFLPLFLDLELYALFGIFLMSFSCIILTVYFLHSFL
ncbi:hypothetical protein [Lacticigenium naphthae]|uniref:hypothetical protein n=1 Tax=Lacticigenium naphthae TaxID=515351 RepID=UPI0004884C64|nr:hypothetical protein [Lacticigenium naphthae]